jgi:hypothetical protein
MKSLKSIVASKADAYNTLMSLLPDRVEQLFYKTKISLGIEGFFYKDLRDSLAEDGYTYTPTSIKSAIKAHGFRPVSIVLPNTKGERATIFTVDPSFGEGGR